MPLPAQLPATVGQAITALARRSLEKGAADTPEPGWLDKAKQWLGDTFTEKDPASTTGGTRLNEWGSTLAGGGLGVAGGGILGALSDDKRPGEGALQGALLGGVGGAGAGALYGFGSRFLDKGPNEDAKAREAAIREAARLHAYNDSGRWNRFLSDSGMPNWGALWKGMPAGVATYGVSEAIHYPMKWYNHRLSSPTVWNALAANPEAHLKGYTGTLGEIGKELQRLGPNTTGASQATARRVGLWSQPVPGTPGTPGGPAGPPNPPQQLLTREALRHALDSQRVALLAGEKGSVLGKGYGGTRLSGKVRAGLPVAVWLLSSYLNSNMGSPYTQDQIDLATYRAAQNPHSVLPYRGDDAAPAWTPEQVKFLEEVRARRPKAP